MLAMPIEESPASRLHHRSPDDVLVHERRQGSLHSYGFGGSMADPRNVLFESAPGVRPFEKRMLVAQIHLEPVCRPLKSICIVFGIVVILALYEIVIGIRVDDELERLAGGG